MANAIDAWIDSIPIDDPYALCPCGCGVKWKYVRVQTENELTAHERRFVENWERTHKHEIHSNV